MTWSATFVALLLLLPLVGTAFANAYWHWLLRHHEAGELVLFLFLVPPIGLGLAAVFVGEALGPLTGLGAVLTIGAVGGLARGRPPGSRRVRASPWRAQRTIRPASGNLQRRVAHSEQWDGDAHPRRRQP